MQSNLENRIEELQMAKAPQILIDAEKAKLAQGDLAAKIGHIKAYGEIEFTDVKNKKYRRGWGARFKLITGHEIDLIPGPFGLFLTPKD